MDLHPTAATSATSDVAVVIPVYNSAATLERALQSVFAQTLPPAEVIIVDDGSHDDPAQVVRRFGSAVQYVSQANAGAAAARNKGVAMASAELIAFLDADDYWHPNKLERQVRAFVSNPHLTLCCTAFRTLESDQALAPWPDTAEGQVQVLKDFASLFASPYLATPTVMVRRRAFLQVGGFRDHLSTAEDVDLWLRLGCSAAVARIESVLVTVVSTAGSTTARRRHGVFLDNLQVIDDFIAAHPDFAVRHKAAIRRARGRVYENWGSGALAEADLITARHRLWCSLRQRLALRPALLLVKALLAARIRGTPQ